MRVTLLVVLVLCLWVVPALGDDVSPATDTADEKLIEEGGTALVVEATREPARVSGKASGGQAFLAFLKAVLEFGIPDGVGFAYVQPLHGEPSEIELVSWLLADVHGWGKGWGDIYIDEGRGVRGGGISAEPEVISPVFLGIGIYDEALALTAGVHVAF